MLTLHQLAESLSLPPSIRPSEYSPSMMAVRGKSTTPSACNSKTYPPFYPYRVNAVLYSMDSRYIVTGSEDTNIRIWKSHASESLHMLLPREKEKLLYNEKLKKKFKYNQEIKRILRHRHLPKFIMKKKQTKHFQKEAKHKKM